MQPLISRKVENDVTFGVSTIGNTKALLLCLASVINADSVPCSIQIRAEGEFPTSDFYLDQLSDLARLSGISLSVTRASSNGVRHARDWHVENCSTEYLWMGDDDVVYDFLCLSNFKSVLNCNSLYKAAYLCGTKIDVNNRRGYVNFDLSKRPLSELRNDCSFNHFYGIDSFNPTPVKVHGIDTGNVILFLNTIRKHRLKFHAFEESANCGGEDTLFALECWHRKLEGYYAAFAVGYHLEKEKPNFGEFAARGEMILRVCEKRGYSKELINTFKETFMPWIKWHSNK